MPARTTAAHFALRLHARPSSASMLRRRLQSWLERKGLEGEEVFDVLLAVSEAFANAVEHPLRPTVSVVDVEGQADNGTLVLTVRDYGRWRDKREREEGSLGFPIMRSLMESVEVETNADGSRITLRRTIHSFGAPAS